MLFVPLTILTTELADTLLLLLLLLLLGDGIVDWVPELFNDLFMIRLDDDDDEEIPLLFKFPDELSDEADEDEQVEETELVLTNWW